MSQKNGSISRRVSFCAEDDKILQERAAEAGMTVAAYIRQQALNREVRVINWELLLQYMEMIYRLEFNIDVYISKHNAEFWMFELDLEFIHEELMSIRKLVEKLLEVITTDQ